MAVTVAQVLKEFHLDPSVFRKCNVLFTPLFTRDGLSFCDDPMRTLKENEAAELRRIMGRGGLIQPGDARCRECSHFSSKEKQV